MVNTEIRLITFFAAKGGEAVYSQQKHLELKVAQIISSYCKIQAKIEESMKNHYPRGSAGKESTFNVGDLGLIPGLGRSPGERNGYPHQYSGLENSMNYTVQEITNSWTQLSDFHFTSGKTTRPLKYDLNQIPCDHTVEMTNRFKGLDLVDRVTEELWTEVCNYRRQ